MTLLLFLIPFFSGIASFFIPSRGMRRVVLVAASSAHTTLALACWIVRPSPELNGWIFLDAIGLIFLAVTSILFLAASIYAAGFLAKETKKDLSENLFFINAPEAVFIGCLLLFLSAMTLVIISQHFGILWVAMEATTLASAPLIYFHKHRRSLEATWKYLLICSVGIALALLGNLFLAASVTGGHDKAMPLVLKELTNKTVIFNPAWLKAAFIFLFVGYGTKMGLAPLHTWLPDAHSEAPAVVSALLSGALLNCAFLGLIRIYQVCLAHGLGGFSRELFLIFGLLSMLFGAMFIFGQADYKRMLAYSSVEHMGILVFAMGIGGSAVFGAMLHVINHSFTKAALFFIAGNILAVYKTKSIRSVHGVLKVLPFSGIIWMTGFLAITGTPPFGIFLSEFIILKSALDGKYGIAAVVYLAVLAIVFIGMSKIIINMAQGSPSEEMAGNTFTERPAAILPQAVLLTFVLILGLYIPHALDSMMHEASIMLGGS